MADSGVCVWRLVGSSSGPASQGFNREGKMPAVVLTEEVERRLNELLARLVAGDDAPPGAVLRLEGLREAAVLAGLWTEAEAQALLERRYAALCDESLAQSLGADWRERYPFPQLPLFARRAPVSPSTAD